MAAFPGPVEYWGTQGLNQDGSPNTNISTEIDPPDITLESSTAITLGGAPIVAAVYGGAISYTDTLLVSVDISRDGGDSDCGILLNYNPAAGGTGYLTTVGFHSGYFDIFKINNGVQEGLTQVAIADFDADTVYSVDFTYKDGHLTASIYDGTSLKGSLSADDSSYTAGTVGALASTTLMQGGANSTAGTFANYDVSDVPEPATMSLLAVGAVAMLRRRK